MKNIMAKLPVWLIKLVIHLASFLPLVWLYTQAFSDGLGADPVKAVIHFTGIGALNLLVLTLLSFAIKSVAKKWQIAAVSPSYRAVCIFLCPDAFS